MSRLQNNTIESAWTRLPYFTIYNPKPLGLFYLSHPACPLTWVHGVKATFQDRLLQACRGLTSKARRSNLEHIMQIYDANMLVYVEVKDASKGLTAA